MIDDVTTDRAARDAEARRWIARLASGAATADDLAELRDWRAADALNEAAFVRERQAWQDLAVIAPAFGSAATPMPAPTQRRWFTPKAAGMAAALAIALLSAPQLALWLRTDHASPRGSISRVTLADGSLAVLDSGAAIDVAYDDGQRAVRLFKGRVWFSVRHGDARPFRVSTEDGVIEDIGTAFEVDATGEQVRIGVTEGRVRVAGEAGQPLVLRAGEAADYASGGAATRIAADPATIASWRNGELLLRAVPLDAAIAAIARYRTAPVFVWGDLAGAAPVSGSFRTDQPEDALATLVMMRGLDQIRLPGGVLILRHNNSD